MGHRFTVVLNQMMLLSTIRLLNLIHYYKFTGALADSTIFVGMLELDNRDYSYIMGLTEEVIGKAFYQLSSRNACPRWPFSGFNGYYSRHVHCFVIWLLL